MSTHTATQTAASQARAERVAWRLRLLASLGPLAALGGVVWAIVQPYRVTLLHPHDQGFWWLFVEPPLLVIAVGLLFYFAVLPGLLEDLEEGRATAG
jgi:ABC-type amino acid transport system permease subunit